MKILMLGNSLTTANHMPNMLGKLLGAEVTVHARGGARLAEQLNPDTKLGAKTVQALQEDRFDYIVLQEMSHGPATAQERYLDSVRCLCDRIRQNGAVPVLYASWAFRPGCEHLQKLGLDAEVMHLEMQEAFLRAESETKALIANVGQAFYERGFNEKLYRKDGLHPSKEGSEIAAKVIAETIWECINESLSAVDDSGEDYLYPPECFDSVEE